MDKSVFSTRNSDRYTNKILLAIAVGLIPILLAAPTLLQPGYPFGNETYSFLIPAIHARDALAAGQFPWHAPWFSGRNIWLNPLFKGVYPLAWPLFVPFISLIAALKILIAIHLFGTAFVSFWIIEKDIGRIPAVAMSLLFVSPIAVQVAVAHYNMLFSWPWLVLAATQIVPWRLQKSPNQAGLIIGICIGMALLAGGDYYSVYIMFILLVGGLTVGRKCWPYLKRSVAGGIIVGLPKIIIIILVMIGGVSRPPVHYKSTLSDILAAISAAHYTPLATLEWPTQTYAVIGLPAMIVGGYGWYRANYMSEKFNQRWSLAVAIIIGFAVLIAGGNRALYMIPGLETLRVASRITVLISVLLLLLAWYAIHESCSSIEYSGEKLKSNMIHISLLLLIIVSAVVGSIGMGYHMGGAGSDYPEGGEQAAAVVSELGCQSTWIMSTPVSDSATGIPMSSPRLALPLTKKGITVRAFHYGSIGQKWKPTTKQGKPTFDALLTGGPLPEQKTISLSASDHPAPVGEVQRDIFTEPVQSNTSAGNVWIYPVEGSCNRN